MFLLQVRFALSSTPVFSRTDTVTDSERFYNSVLDLLDDIEEREEVNDLLVWWNRCVIIYLFQIYLRLTSQCSQIFPNCSVARRSIKNSALARIKEKRLELKAITNIDD
jgi:hypothetical protein